jgi:hypothetical protein
LISQTRQASDDGLPDAGKIALPVYTVMVNGHEKRRNHIISVDAWPACPHNVPVKPALSPFFLASALIEMRSGAHK